MVRQIVIEAETPGNSRTMFRLRIDASAIAEGLTAVQAHVLVGEILRAYRRAAVAQRAGDSYGARRRSCASPLVGWRTADEIDVSRLGLEGEERAAR